MKTLTIILLITAMTTLKSESQSTKTFHDFTVMDIHGKEFRLDQLKGKKVLVVNTASRCGFTPQYEDLQKLFTRYGGEEFTIIGFPANNFLRQEPGSNEEILEFCSMNYGVTFPMMAKVSVKGKKMHPVYQWLTQKEQNGTMDSKVSWNFQKYMIDENGHLVGTLPPKTKPLDPRIIDWITEN